MRDQKTHRLKSFRPHSRLLALEPRVLFDGAAAVAVEQQVPADAPSPQAPETHAINTLVVIDSRVNDADLLSREAGKSPDSRVVMVDQGDDGLALIAKALEAAGRIDAVQIYSHGAAGQFNLGSRTLSADNISTAGRELQGWSANLGEDADILLLGCNVGSGQSGAALLSALAALTSADVAASTNDTGSEAKGGDWVLEAATGAIESVVPVLATYEGLLANASPEVSLSTAATDVLLGGQFSFTATFTNPSTQTGFAPFIDLILPATGKDGAGAEIDDGITFVSATYLGQTVLSYVITFDASGNASHPLAKDSAGQTVIVNAATYGAQAGDQLVVLQLPYSSVTAAQPSIAVVVTCLLSDLADTDGSPDLTIKARGGFEYGNDSTNNPTVDPSLFQTGMQNLAVHPTGLQLTQSVSAPEGETVTGPNFTRSLTVTATPPAGQTLTNVEVTQSLPDSIRVLSITPGAGGVVSSITIASTGRVVTDSGSIAFVLGVAPRLSAYTVTYSSLTAAVSTVVAFYVGEKDSTGNNVLDPVSGNDRTIVFGQPTATGEWLPLDIRDQTVADPGTPPVIAPATVTVTGDAVSLVVKSIALRKSVAIAANAGNAGLSPGDELQYTLNVDISDFFTVGKTLLGAGSLQIVDTLSDGQSFINGSAHISIDYQGQTFVVPVLLTAGPGPAGASVITFDVAQALLDINAIFGGALIGDLAIDGNIEGATRMVVTYRTIVAHAYGATYPQSEINEGDSLGNDATVSGTLLSSLLTLTNEGVDDGSSASLTVPTRAVTTSILSVNGAAPPANGELRPGDLVTFKLAYNLVTGDYENFRLRAYLPLPLFDVGGLGWTQGAGPGQWSYGIGDTSAGTVVTVASGSGNSIVFDFGNYENSGINGDRIEVLFTLEVGNQPFADQRSLTVLGQSEQVTTISQSALVSSGVVNIASIAEPMLSISHGVIDIESGGGQITDAGAPPPVTDLDQLDSNVVDIDAGDVVNMATTIKNSGGLGAFDVTSTVNLPAGLSFAAGNMAASMVGVFRGDLGVPLVEGTDYSISGNTITFLDAGGLPSLKEGRAGTPNDLSGDNVVVIIYRVRVDATAEAGRNFQSSAALTNYSSADGGSDFTLVDLTDSATAAMAAPVIVKYFANGSISNDDSSAVHTAGANLVVGESMLFDIVVTLPEGVTQSLRLSDLIPQGMTLDSSFGNGGYQLITTTALSTALPANFSGTVAVSGANAPGGDGGDLVLTFGSTTTTAADNNTANDSFVVRVRLIASNVSANQTSRTNANDAALVYSDPDGNIPGSGAAVDKTVILSGVKPTISIVEPKLVITQKASTDGNSLPGQVDAGDLVTYTITIRNGNTASDFNAFDISFSDILPAELSALSIRSVGYAGGATNNGGSDFTITGSALTTTTGANIDIPKGGSITLVVDGLVNSNAANVADFTNTAEVRWTSLDGSSNAAQPNERTGADGVFNNGSLNDYRQRSNLKLLVVFGANISHVGGLPDTPTPAITDESQAVAVGEIIRYRTGFLLAEGVTNGATVKVALGAGLTFVNDGTATIGLLSDLPMDNAPNLTTGANPDIVGSVGSLPELIAADLSNTTTAPLSPVRINTANPREIVFSLGDLSNTDLDSNKEVIYLDFNVRVDNSGAVDTSKSLSASAKLFSGGGGTLIDKTQVINENVVEPNLRNLQKTVTDFDPNTSGSTGTATITLAFSNEGDGAAYDSRLTDAMSGGSNYQLQSLKINGIDVLGSLPPGVTVNDAGGITANFSALAIGSTVELVYTVEVSNTVVHAPSDATLIWSSLPEDFNAYAGTSVGADGSISGERDDGSLTGVTPNTYLVREGAGLGVIAGTLWDDTSSATASATPDGPGIAGQTVTLTWAGVDGDLISAGDNKTFSTISDASGIYNFGVLASGRYAVTTPASIAGHNFGSGTDPVDDLAARIDTDGGTLASVTISALGEGAASAANVGFVRENDAPVNTLPVAPTTLEDTLLAISGITVADVDAASLNMRVTLSAGHGRLNLSATGLASSSGLNTATVIVTGSQAALNAALATLTYLPDQDYNGTDKLRVITSDLGSFGDNDGNGTPGQVSDALTDADEMTINITPVNDAPIGVNDAAIAIEAGGVGNSVGGIPGVATVLSNDIDVDIVTNGDVLEVSKIGFGVAPPTTAVGLGYTLQAGSYGELAINAGGNARYLVDNNNAAIQALRLSSDTLIETFTYELKDSAGVTSTATITVTIRGNNDTPVGVDDDGFATEKGSVNNSSGGGSAVGNVLANDTDVDSVVNGETKAVSGIRFKRESQSGTMIGVPSDNSSVTINGSHGAFTIQSNGNYSYAISNEGATAVQRLVPGDTLIEYFSYEVSDGLGDTDIAQIRIIINGANDNPVASDDQAIAQAKSSNPGSTEINPTGNVIRFQSRPGAITQPGGNGIDADADRTDQPNSLLTVNGIRAGIESLGDTTTAVSGVTVVSGTYGALTINPNGSFSYDVDSTNPAVVALAAGATLTDSFTYRVVDTTSPTGLTDLAALNIIVRGANDPPVASDVFAEAVEAGGVANGLLGTDPTGDALINDFDPDGNALSVLSFRTGTEAGSGTSGVLGNALQGRTVH